MLLASVALLSASCRPSEKQTIEKVAGDYALATSNYQLDEAEAYCTKETSESTLRIGRFLISQIDTAYILSDTPATVEILESAVTSDTTAYAVYHKKTPIKDFVDTLNLRRRDGQWLVHEPVKKIPKKDNPSL